MGKDLIGKAMDGVGDEPTAPGATGKKGRRGSGWGGFPWKFIGLLASPFILCCCLMCLNAVGQTTVYMMITGQERVTICEKDSVPVDGENQYRVTTDKGVFVVSDIRLPWAWRTNSADVYGSLRVGSVYDIKTRGFRWSAVSAFPNIEEATEASYASPAAC